MTDEDANQIFVVVPSFFTPFPLSHTHLLPRTRNPQPPRTIVAALEDAHFPSAVGDSTLKSEIDC